MVESISATYLLGHRPTFGGCCGKDVLGRKIVVANPLPRLGATRLLPHPIKAQASELTKEFAYIVRERLTRSLDAEFDTADRQLKMWPPENKADKPSLRNPLLRQERMGAGWLGAIFEWEGVLIEDNPDLDKQAWLVIAEEEGKSPPATFMLKRVEGMKNEQAISEVLCWSRDPSQVKRMASRKEEIYQKLRCEKIYRLRSGSRDFVNVLMQYNIPMALVSTRPRTSLEEGMRDVGIEGVFNAVVAAEDVNRGKPDPEMFAYACQLLQIIPQRCIVFGNSNQTVEAAHDARMKCVIVASKQPRYEVSSADRVVRRLDELSLVDLKNLGAVESAEFEEPELESEEDDWDTTSSEEPVDDDIWQAVSNRCLYVGLGTVAPSCPYRAAARGSPLSTSLLSLGGFERSI